MKARIKDKLKGDPTPVPATAVKQATVATAALALLLCVCGCQSLIPSARSNQASYDGMVKIGDNARIGTLSVTIGDGLIASADGGGDSQSNTPTQTISPQTQLSYGVGTGGGSTWGELFSGIASMFSAKTSTTASTDTAATAAKTATAECADGKCEEK